MKKMIAIICLTAGSGLLVWGYREAQTLKGQLHRFVTSSTENRITWMYVSGAVLCTVGVVQIYTAKK